MQTKSFQVPPTQTLLFLTTLCLPPTTAGVLTISSSLTSLHLFSFLATLQEYLIPKTTSTLETITFLWIFLALFLDLSHSGFFWGSGAGSVTNQLFDFRSGPQSSACITIPWRACSNSTGSNPQSFSFSGFGVRP